MQCYEDTELHFDDPIFENMHAYLITMHDSTRHKSYMEQLRQHRPCARVTIVQNLGFKHCAKDGVQTTAQDLWHANQYIASRALASGVKTVLILEDDVHFTDALREQAPHIEAHIQAHTGEPLAYSLGSCFAASAPRGPHHLRVWSGTLTHAMIYNEVALARFAAISVWWLHDVELFPRLTTYASRRCCATQTIEMTENSKSWDIFGLPGLAFRALGGGDEKRLFSRFHDIGACGGVVPVMLGLCTIVLVSISCVRKVQSVSQRSSVRT